MHAMYADTQTYLAHTGTKLSLKAQQLLQVVQARMAAHADPRGVTTSHWPHLKFEPTWAYGLWAAIKDEPLFQKPSLPELNSRQLKLIGFESGLCDAEGAS